MLIGAANIGENSTLFRGENQCLKDWLNNNGRSHPMVLLKIIYFENNLKNILLCI